MASQFGSSFSFSQEFLEKQKFYEEEDKKAMSGDDDHAYKVELFIYDLTKGFAKQLSPSLLGKQIEGIWHSGVVAYGREYFFGSGGIQSCPPGGTILGEPSKIEDLGSSQVPYQLFLEYIFGLGESKFAPGAYDLLKHNCNNFSEEVSEFLCGRGIPKYILNLPNEVLNTELGSILAPLAKALQLKSTDSKTVSLGGAQSIIQTYVPREIDRPRDDTEFEVLNSAIEEVRFKTQQLETRRNTLNEKLIKKEKKRLKKERKKKNKSQADLSSFEEPRRRRNRGDSVHFASEPEVLTNGISPLRRLSVPSIFPSESGPIPLPKSILRNHHTLPPLPTRQKPPTPESVQDRLSYSRRISNSPETLAMADEESEVPTATENEVSSTNGAEAVTDREPSEEGATPEDTREPPIIYKEDVDAVVDFDEFVQFVAEMLTEEEQKYMEQLRGYVVEDEGSWSLGEDFNKLFIRIFFDSGIPVEAQRSLIRIMAAASLKDDVILMLHQDRREHTIMNFANKIESHPAGTQEALALFICNMFCHLSPSEWLLYISEWTEGSQQLSNIRITTKIAVNALLHANPKVVEYGTAIMYNLGTKEVKTVVFDDVAPELAMAILQYLGSHPAEEFLWRTLSALCRFCYGSTEVPTLIQMIGPDPNTFKGASERVDAVLEEINAKLSKARPH